MGAYVIRVCAWCKPQKELSRTYDQTLNKDMITHTMCDQCRAEQKRQLEELRKGKGNEK